MIIREEIEKLRGDVASQLRAQSCMVVARAECFAVAESQRIVRDLQRYGAGGALNDCSELVDLLRDADKATRWISRFASNMSAALADEPLASVPFRHNLTDEGASLILASEGRAQLLLVERAPGSLKAESVAFNPVERCDIVLAGNARGQLVELRVDGVPPVQTPVAITSGYLFQSGGGEVPRALLIEQVNQPLVTLRLVRHPVAAMAQPTLQVALPDGSVLRRAAGSVAESRQEIALSLLGAMGRGDAAPVAAQMSREGPANLRWQALRHALAMDTAQGFAALTAIAAQSDDPLAANARALRDQLIAAHPVLEQLAA